MLTLQQATVKAVAVVHTSLLMVQCWTCLDDDRSWLNPRFRELLHLLTVKVTSVPTSVATLRGTDLS